VQVSWLWPKHLNEQDSAVIRIARVIHWSFVGLAAFFAVVSTYGMVQGGDTEPITYFAVLFMWVALAMIGRGIRYIIAKE
jgi:hypothetical protein